MLVFGKQRDGNMTIAPRGKDKDVEDKTTPQMTTNVTSGTSSMKMAVEFELSGM